MLFYQNHGVDDFAHRDFLSVTSSPPVLVFGAYTLMVGAREPIPQSVAQEKNPRFQLRFGKAMQGGRMFVGYEILDNFACQGFRVGLDQLNQSHGKHLPPPGERVQRSANNLQMRLSARFSSSLFYRREPAVARSRVTFRGVGHHIIPLLPTLRSTRMTSLRTGNVTGGMP